MNNLVDYGADSDEESPRRRSSEGQSSMVQKFIDHKAKMDEEKRKRRSSDVYGENSDDDDFQPPQMCSEPPPPPKRVTYHSPTSPAAFRTPILGMSHTTSQASLVSYSGDGDEEDDDDDDGIISDTSNSLPKRLPLATPTSDIQEPAPPPRRSRNNEEEDDEEQKLMDEAMSGGMMRMNQEGGADTPGHDSVVDSPIFEDLGDGTPSHQDASPTDQEVIRIPPPPDVEVNPKLVSVFENAFRQKANGIDLNKQIQGNPKYNNPMIYTTFIETFDIDEKGTNFPKAIFDPHVFPDNCYYDAIGEEQRKAQEGPHKKK